MNAGKTKVTEPQLAEEDIPSLLEKDPHTVGGLSFSNYGNMPTCKTDGD